MAIDMNMITTMTTEGLYELNRQVVAVIRHRANEKQRHATVKFRVGDKACFHSKGAVITIRIDRINVKTISGLEVARNGVDRIGAQWRVAPSLLSQIAT